MGAVFWYLERLTEKGEDVCEDALRYSILQRGGCILVYRNAHREEGGCLRGVLRFVFYHIESVILVYRGSQIRGRMFVRILSGILSYEISTFGIQRLTEKGGGCL
jgi:hypothetical protein